MYIFLFSLVYIFLFGQTHLIGLVKNPTVTNYFSDWFLWSHWLILIYVHAWLIFGVTYHSLNSNSQERKPHKIWLTTHPTTFIIFLYELFFIICFMFVVHYSYLKQTHQFSHNKFLFTKETTTLVELLYLVLSWAMLNFGPVVLGYLTTKWVNVVWLQIILQ